MRGWGHAVVPLALSEAVFGVGFGVGGSTGKITESDSITLTRYSTRAFWGGWFHQKHYRV